MRCVSRQHFLSDRNELGQEALDLGKPVPLAVGVQIKFLHGGSIEYAWYEEHEHSVIHPLDRICFHHRHHVIDGH